MNWSRILVAFLCLVVVAMGGCIGPLSDTPSDEATSGQGEGERTGTLTVHNINVGQSVSTLIVGPGGETILIDTGDFTADGQYTLRYLRQNGVTRIDHLVTSHADADHIGGHAAVIEYYETQANGVGAVYDPGIAASTQTYEEYLDAVEKYDVTLYETRRPDTIPFDNASVSVLGPPADPLRNGDRNENSIVLRVAFGQTSFLYTGDAERAAEAALVEAYEPSQLQATVYKAGHHGSRSSSSDALLDAVDPQVAVISSAYDSQYGHPHEEVLQRLAERSVQTYWTGVHGDTVFASDGETVSIRTQQTGPTDPQLLSTGSPIDPATNGAVSERTTITGENTTGHTQTQPINRTVKLSVSTINADARGDDRRNLRDEYVNFTNTGEQTLLMTDWTLTDGVGKQYRFPDGFTLKPGATVTVFTGRGVDTETDLYWDAESPVWNNDGDTITVRTDTGQRIVNETYS